VGKGQNKWCEGVPLPGDHPTGILFNDMDRVQAERKGGWAVLGRRGITVCVTSNYAPEDLREALPEEREGTVIRRFTIIEIR
jgi:hypothetical protein